MLNTRTLWSVTEEWICSKNWHRRYHKSLTADTNERFSVVFRNIIHGFDSGGVDGFIYLSGSHSTFISVSLLWFKVAAHTDSSVSFHWLLKTTVSFAWRVYSVTATDEKVRSHTSHRQALDPAPLWWQTMKEHRWQCCLVPNKGCAAGSLPAQREHAVHVLIVLQHRDPLESLQTWDHWHCQGCF